MDGSPHAPVRENADEERFEVELGGHLAYLTYARLGNQLFLLHTEVPQEMGGRGIASLLLRTALDRARGEGRSVVAFCPFAKSWLARHTEYADVVAPDEG